LPPTRKKCSDDLDLPHLKARSLLSYFLPTLFARKAQTEAGQISRGAVAAPQHWEVSEGSVLPEKKGAISNGEFEAVE
jgi:hypothetical protein